MEKKQLNEMFDNLLHIGNKTNYWNPKMKKYIYGSVNGIHVINLVVTVEKIEETKQALKELHTSGKKILFVGTKLQARDAIAKLASESWHFYVTDKWVPWLLTNFKTIKRRIATYLQLSKDMQAWVFDVLTKKEKASKMLELEKLDKAYKWVKDMKKIPDVVFVVDGVYEDQAVKEANILNLTSFAILSTNGDDTVVDYAIPANTNAVTSIEYVLNALKEAISGKVVAQAPQRWVAPNTRVKKVEDRKVSWEKKTAPVKTEKSAPAKAETKVEKVEETKEEVKEEKTPAKAPTTKKPAPAKAETKEEKVEETKEEVKKEKAPAKTPAAKKPAPAKAEKAEEAKVEKTEETKDAEEK